MKKIFLTLAFLLLLSSCSINGNLEGLYSYYDTAKSKNPDLLINLPASLDVCQIEKTAIPKVFITNGQRFRKCIRDSNDMIVYIWSPKCKGKFCYSLNALQRKCDDKRIELYIVAEYYDVALMQMDYEIKHPIYGIDTQYYRTNLTSKYVEKFFYDLTAKTDLKGRFVRFKKGVYYNTVESIDQI